MVGLSKAVVAVAIACALAGCGQQMNQRQSNTLLSGWVQVGMTRAEVEGRLGFPQKIEKVGTTAFYYYAPGWHILPTMVSPHSPIAIADGMVVGMGKAYYDEAVANATSVASAPH
jgi:hypothetical protein